jgi:hypothetical protein
VIVIISIGILQINPRLWLDLNSPRRYDTWLFSGHRAAFEPKSPGEFMKVDKFDSSH